MKSIRPHHIISALAIGGIALSVFNSRPPFTDLNQFVLIARDKIHLASSTQISSGDLASNGEIFVAENDLINGNLFADKIRLAENTTINGNVSFNNLRLAEGARILGATSTPISLPIIELPQVPVFEAGTQSLIIDENQTISPGSFNKIEIKPGIALTLNPGTYNLNQLGLREKAKLFFSGPTTVNIKEELRVASGVLIAQNANIPSTDLQINYADKKLVTAGENSFLSFKLLAPNAKVQLGDNETLRGRVWAKEVNIGKSSILSRQDFFAKESDSAKIATNNGVMFVVNEIVLVLNGNVALGDIETITNVVEGRLTGFLPKLQLAKIEVGTANLNDLTNKVTIIKNLGSPFVIDAAPNVLFNLLN